MKRVREAPESIEPLMYGTEQNVVSG